MQEEKKPQPDRDEQKPAETEFVNCSFVQSDQKPPAEKCATLRGRPGVAAVSRIACV